ncbi:MAG TPA: hypothetical protein VF458_13175, partial [Ktedonobacteraceae bacterium]
RERSCNSPDSSFVPGGRNIYIMLYFSVEEVNAINSCVSEKGGMVEEFATFSFKDQVERRTARPKQAHTRYRMSMASRQYITRHGSGQYFSLPTSQQL